jgi:WD40 repeat protein/ABC-type dipeptide/oligopeptide/nickel transport system ATPase component
VTPDNTRIVTCSSDHLVRIWDLATGKSIGQPLAGHTNAVFQVAIAPDNSRIVTGGGDNTVWVWDLATGKPIGRPIAEIDDAVFSLAVTADGTRVVAGDADRSVWIWDLATGLHVGQPLTGHDGPVDSVAVTPDNTHVITASRDRTVRIWDLTTREPLGQTVIGHGGPVHSVAVTADGTRMVTGSGDRAVRIWELAPGEPVGRVVAEHDSPVLSVAVTPDGTRMVTGGSNDALRMWDVTTQEPAGRIPLGGARTVRSLAITPDGARVVSGSDGNMAWIWELTNGAPIGQPLTGHTRPVRSVAVTPDGTRIVTGSFDCTVRVWDLVTGQQVGSPLTGHTDTVGSVAVTPDGTRIVSGSHDCTVRVWDLATGQPVGQPLVGHTGPVWSVAVTPDGTRIISGSEDATARIWRPFGSARVELYAGIVTDAESPTDRLSMRVDVQTVAALLAATTTAPPLSVALMGNWGSGKSTFMRLVIDEVNRLANAYRPDRVYVRNVRQVRFNAWHYSDDHLWVGLAEHLFRELRRTPVAGQHPDFLPSPATLAHVRAELATEQASQAHLAAVLEEVDELDPERGGWIVWLGQVRRALLVFRHAGADLREQLRRRAVIVSLLCTLVVVTGVVGSVVLSDRLFGWLQSLGWVTAAIAAVGAVIAPLRLIWNKARTATTAARTQLLLSQQRHADRIRALEDTLTELDPVRRLDQLLVEISATDRYASYRGLTGRIHHDLQRLNQQLSEAHRDDPAQQWRIILYIDDLDRCVASRVVEVLQAVNLLLSMELFLVVVAVDPRWLLRAIDEHHGALLNAKPTIHADDGDHAKQGRPLDYLDKIFHVPYAIRPAGAHAADYLRSLLPNPNPPVPSTTSTTPRRVPSPPRRTSTSGEPPTDTAPPATAPDVLLASRISTASVRLPGPVNATNLYISQAEADFLPLLADLLPTPRAMKKLANLYRLLRIAVPAWQLPSFLGDKGGGPYQAAALLLACVVGDPGQARQLLEYLVTAPPDEDIVTTPHDEDAMRRPALLTRLVDHIVSLGATTPIHTKTDTYREWAVTVARYSFETYEMFTGS